MINISGINKAKLLLALHKNSRSQGMSILHERTVTLQECIERLKQDLYVDYFAGRVIKVDFEGGEINPDLYDRDLGVGACQKVVDSLRTSI